MQTAAMPNAVFSPLALTLAATCLTALVAGTARAQDSIKAAAISASLDQSAAMPPVARSFVGFSIEYSWIDQLTTQDHDRQQAFINLLNDITTLDGPVIIRIGGNSQDEAAYNIKQYKTRPKYVHINLSDQTFDQLKQLAQATGCKYILGLNLRAHRPDLAEQLVKNANRVVGAEHIIGYEIGNESDFY